MPNVAESNIAQVPASQGAKGFTGIRMTDKQQKRLCIAAFLVLPLTLLCVFSFYPALQLFHYSLTDWDGFDLSKNYVGLENYVEVFTNEELFSVFANNMYYFVGGVLQIMLALYFAVVLNSGLRGKNIFKALLFLPFVMNSVAIVLIFRVFYQPDGTLNTVLDLMGLGMLKQSWLGNPAVVNFSLAFTSMWRYMGLNLVIFLGALQSISPIYYEAAKLDGANEWHQFRYITLPILRPILGINFLLTISGAIEVFEIPFIMTRGANGSMTFVIQTVETAFRFNNVGLASAMAVVLLAIVIVVISIQKKLFDGEAK